MTAEQKLRIALRANAVFSMMSGMVLVAWTSGLAEFMGIDRAPTLRVVGIGLMLFAGSVFWAAGRASIQRTQVRSIIVQDWLWVIASSVVIGLQAFGLTLTGYIIVGVVAILIADFAIVQCLFLRRMRI